VLLLLLFLLLFLLLLQVWLLAASSRSARWVRPQGFVVPVDADPLKQKPAARQAVLLTL
jgi:hypothetical protein